MTVLPFRAPGAKAAPWTLDALEAPWDGPPIFDHIVACVDAASRAERDSLPDDDTFFAASEVRWAAGQMDCTGGPHADDEEPPPECAGWIFDLLIAVLHEPTAENVGALYEAAMANVTLDYVDDLLDLVYSDRSLDFDRLTLFADWLARRAADREPLKLAIALLGAAVDDGPLELVRTLGRHEELTLFASYSMINLAPRPDRALWKLAEQVRGWGRIHLVERLAETGDETIMDWMLREGYRNEILEEYLAYTCAISGCLTEVLIDMEEDSDVDEKLLRGAGDILRVLITGIEGPAPKMTAYDEGAEAADVYLALLAQVPRTVDQLPAVAALRDYARNGEDGERWGLGWSKERRAEVEARAGELLEWPGWEELVREGLKNDDAWTFRRAVDAAEVLGIDAWEPSFERLKANGEDWRLALRTDDPARMEQILALAASTLPLASMAEKPYSMDPLDLLLEALERFPGVGWDLIHLGLNSNAARNRELAVQALRAWGMSEWPPEAMFLVHRARSEETNERVRKAFDSLLMGRGL